MAIKKYVIPLLLGQRNNIITTPACLVTDDIQAYQFKFLIKDNEGFPVDTSWVNYATIKMAKPDNNVIIGSVEVVDAAAGLFAYELGTNELAVEGHVLATLQLYDGTPNPEIGGVPADYVKRITTQMFKFRVIHELVGESEIPSTTEYSVEVR